MSDRQELTPATRKVARGDRRRVTSHFSLSPVPGPQHVLLAQLAGVANERELQAVFAANELVDAFAIAAFRPDAAGSPCRQNIAIDRVLAPRIPLTVLV